MDPQNPDYAYDLGFALNKNGNHSEALSVLQRTQRNSHETGRLLWVLG